MKKLSLLLVAAALAAPALAQTDAPYVGPGTVVTAQREADQAITNVVIGRIAADPLISGRVGVETNRNVVTLTGRVGTAVQADRAAWHAMRTQGVREVDNQLRSLGRS